MHVRIVRLLREILAKVEILFNLLSRKGHPNSAGGVDRSSDKILGIII